MISDLLTALRHHWMKSFLVFFLILGGVVAGTYLSPRLYRSRAKLLVRLGRENAVLDPTSTIGEGPVVAVPYSREMEMNSVTETVGSEVLLEQLIDHLGPAVVLGKEPLPERIPEPVLRVPSKTTVISSKEKEPAKDREARHRAPAFQKALATLQKRMRIEAVPKSNVISISYEGPTPELSQQIVRTLVSLAVEYHIHLHRSPRGHEFLAEQAQRLRKQLYELQNEKQELEELSGIFYPEEQRKAIVAKIARFEEELALTLGQIEASVAEIAAVRERLSDLSPTQVISKTTGVSNQAVDSMRGQLYALQLRELELIADKPAGHPAVRNLRKQIEEARSILAKEESSRVETTTGPNKLYEEAQLVLIRQAPALASLKAKKTSVEKQLGEAKTELETFAANAVELGNLQREIDLNTTSYSKYAENVEQSKIDRALEDQKISNISVVQPANYDPEPTRPRWLVNVGAGFALAMMAAVSLAWISDSGRRERVPSPDSSQLGRDDITSKG